MTEATTTLTRAEILAGQVANPEEVISDLRKCSAKDGENEQLRLKVAEQDKTMTAMISVKQVLDASGKDGLKGEVENAIAFKHAYEEASGSKLTPEGIVKRAKDCADAEAKAAALAKENQNLRGQITFMSKQVSGLKGTKGFGLPPCWVDEAGRAQRLVNVEVTERGVVVRPGWPPERNDDAKRLPNIEALVAAGVEQTIVTFKLAATPILDWSRNQDPECRHYASIGVSAASVNSSVAGENAANEYFYPFGKVSIVKK